MKKTLLITASVIVFILGIVTLSVTGLKLLGVETYSNNDGSIIYVKHYDCESIEPGNVILYEVNSKGDISTNTVIDIDYEKKHFLISSSELSLPDGSEGSFIVSTTPIDFSAYIGRRIFRLPYLGYFSDFVSTQTGFYVLTGLTFVCFMIILLVSILPLQIVKETDDGGNVKVKEKAASEIKTEEPKKVKKDKKKKESEKKPEKEPEKANEPKPEDSKTEESKKNPSVDGSKPEDNNKPAEKQAGKENHKKSKKHKSKKKK